VRVLLQACRFVADFLIFFFECSCTPPPLRRFVCSAGTSVISLILQAGSQLPAVTKLLTEELGTASCIKSRVNRLSVISAITSVQERLKRYRVCPPNGLVLYCGEVEGADGKPRKVTIDFEPFKPMSAKLYMCDNRFHTEPLAAMLEDDLKFGYIVIDGEGTLFGTVQGRCVETLQKVVVDLPKKHGRGGQSALRFARLRLEKRHNYVRKIAELAVTHFLPGGERPNVRGLILAGAAELKEILAVSPLLDPRLASIILKVVDTSYGMENGFKQAIAMSKDALLESKINTERAVVQDFFEEISRDSGRYSIGLNDTMTALELSAIDKLIVWEDLDVIRFQLRNPVTGALNVVFLPRGAPRDRGLFTDPLTGADVEIVEENPFVEWLVDHYKDFGVHLIFVSDRTSEGNQFVKGFGGVGATLRWKVDVAAVTDMKAGGIHTVAAAEGAEVPAYAVAGAGIDPAAMDDDIDFM
jgi:peptide chain release factor subunit 1